MNCPKCSCNIDESTLICPNCKKVLKLACPVCNTINKTNTCKKCGFVIVSKCHQCGKINHTIKEKCPNCGFNTYTSVAINSSNIDEFACLTIEFPNIDEIKFALNSTKLFEKFKTNLDNLILNYTRSLGLTRQIIDNIYIIRFNKDYTFSASAHNAMNAAITIQNLVTELNFKLDNLEKQTLVCNIAVLKRDIYARSDEYKSGFNIKLLYLNKKKLKLLNNLQIIADAGVYEAVCNDFSLSSLSANVIKNEMSMFFELDLKKYIKIPVEKPQEKTEELVSTISFEEDYVEYEDENDDIYNVESINFEELKCNFTKVKSIDFIPEILSIFKKNSKNIISVKSDKKFIPRTHELLKSIEDSNNFERIFTVTCYDEMKYKPYGFFYELISSIYGYSQSPKCFSKNDFTPFAEIDPSGFINDLINLNKRDFPHPEDVRYSLFDIFLNVFYSMPNALIYIENIEKIDDTSYEVLQLIFERFENLNVSYLLMGDKDFALHKTSHFLLSKSYYTEITMKSTPFSQIIEKNMHKFKNVLDSYYIQKISHITKGSTTYFYNAIDYLLDCGLLIFDGEAYSMSQFENVLIPAGLDELITRRMKLLSEFNNAYKLFGLILLTAPRVDFLTINLFNIPNYMQEIQILSEKDYVYIYENNVYVQNYNLYKEIFFKNMPADLRQAFASALLKKAFLGEVSSPVEAFLYNILENEKNEFIIWEKLSYLNTSMGDFSAYLNCSLRFLKLIDKHIDENSQKTIDEYKMEVYENLSNLLYKYTPEKIQNIAQIILDNLEKSTEDQKVINLCNKMLQGCLISGDYSHALKLTHKILSKFPNSSLNPNKKNFNIAYFLISLVKIEVLFGIGNLKDCVELGDEILDVISKKTIPMLRPEHLSPAQFDDLIFANLGFVALSRLILLKDDLGVFLHKLKSKMGNIPASYELFFALYNIIRGINVELDENNIGFEDKFAKIIFNFVNAFNNKENPKKFASFIYQAKINAKLYSLSQIELICDLFIGYSYFKLKEDRKASSIYYNVLETSTKNGLQTVTYFAWYLISILKIEQNDIDVAFGVVNNATIQLEKDENSSELLLFLFKTALSKILFLKNEPKKAEFCLSHAKFIKEKYGLNIKIED